MKKKVIRAIIVAFLCFLLGGLIITLTSCKKTDECTIVCAIEPLPDTLMAGEPFQINALPSVDESTCTLASFFTVQSLDYPIVTHTEHYSLITTFVVEDQGWNTIRVTVYKGDNEWSDMIEQDIYFK